MMKMLIKLDEDRIKTDGKYNRADLWRVIDGQFNNGCIKEVQPDGAVLYSGDPTKDYYTRINLAAIVLKKTHWFGKYCTKWIWYDNDDNEELPFQDIDVLERQRKNNPLFAV